MRNDAGVNSEVEKSGVTPGRPRGTFTPGLAVQMRKGLNRVELAPGMSDLGGDSGVAWE